MSVSTDMNPEGYMYLVYAFNVLACEPEDVMEDLGFIYMKGIFSDRQEAENQARMYALSGMGKSDFIRSEKPFREDDEVFLETHYITREEIKGEIELNELNAFVVSVRRVPVNPKNICVVKRVETTETTETRLN